LEKLTTYLDPSTVRSLAMEFKKNSKLLVVIFVVFLVHGKISRGEYDGKSFLFNANFLSLQFEQEM